MKRVAFSLWPSQKPSGLAKNRSLRLSQKNRRASLLSIDQWNTFKVAFRLTAVARPETARRWPVFMSKVRLSPQSAIISVLHWKENPYA
jgi:hypothetical protein